jgi:hypothetical protein
MLQRIEHLDRDLLAQRDMCPDVDRAHAANREQSLDAVLCIEHRARVQLP